MEHVAVMAGKWFRSSYSVLLSIISLLQSLFTKSESPQPPQLPLSQPPPPPFISNSTAAMKTLPSSSDDLSSNPITTTSRSFSVGFSAQLHSVLENINNTQTLEPSQSQRRINPIVQLLRDHELGKTVLTYVIPMTTGALTVYTKHYSSSTFPPLPLPSILLSLCIGLTLLWNGILLRGMLPDTVANAMEQFGAACIFFAFFTVVSTLLPPNLVWVPWTCFAAILLPSILSCIPVSCIPVRDTVQIQ